MAASIAAPTKSKITFSNVLQVLGYTLTVLASVALIWLAQSTLFWCYGYSGGCGTPCATSSFELLVAPIILTLPFVKLLFVKGLSAFGLIARCAVTSGIGVWVVTVTIVFSKGSIL